MREGGQEVSSFEFESRNVFRVQVGEQSPGRVLNNATLVRLLTLRSLVCGSLKPLASRLARIVRRRRMALVNKFPPAVQRGD
jgi:hypothetical protein